MRTINILSGPPAAGKSTWGKQFAKDNDYIYLSRDEFRNKLREERHTDDYFPVSANDERDLWYNYINTNINNNTNALGFVIDQTTLTYESLALLYIRCHLDKEKNVNLIRFGNISLNECIERNEKRMGYDYCPQETIRLFYKLFHQFKNRYPNHITEMENIQIINL